MILLFAKAPLPGRVKTRLIPALGAELACRVHEALLQRSMAELSRVACRRVLMCTEPHPLFTRLAAQFGFELDYQCAGGLGERMQRALMQASASMGGDPANVVLLGSDALFTADDVRQALAALAQHDAVMVPAYDGGYILIGTNGHSAFFDNGIFRKVRWGSASALNDTRHALQARGVKLALLATRHDVDEPADVRYACQHGWLDASLLSTL